MTFDQRFKVFCQNFPNAENSGTPEASSATKKFHFLLCFLHRPDLSCSTIANWFFFNSNRRRAAAQICLKNSFDRNIFFVPALGLICQDLESLLRMYPSPPLSSTHCIFLNLNYIIISCWPTSTVLGGLVCVCSQLHRELFTLAHRSQLFTHTQIMFYNIHLIQNKIILMFHVSWFHAKSVIVTKSSLMYLHLYLANVTCTGDVKIWIIHNCTGLLMPGVCSREKCSRSAFKFD